MSALNATVRRAKQATADRVPPTYSISALAQEFALTTRAIRFYEDEGLLAPRRHGQTRIYGERERTRIKLILRGKRFGFSLEDIRQLLDMYDHNPVQQAVQLERTYELANERLKVMEQQRDELNEAIDELKAQLAWGEDMLKSLRKSGAA